MEKKINQNVTKGGEKTENSDRVQRYVVLINRSETKKMVVPERVLFLPDELKKVKKEKGFHNL